MLILACDVDDTSFRILNRCHGARARFGLTRGGAGGRRSDRFELMSQTLALGNLLGSQKRFQFGQVHTNVGPMLVVLGGGKR